MFSSDELESMTVPAWDAGEGRDRRRAIVDRATALIDEGAARARELADLLHRVDHVAAVVHRP